MKRIGLLLNPMAASATSARQWPGIGQALQAAGHDVQMIVGASRDHSLSLARQCVADGVDALVAVGGDGTVRTALQAVAHTDTPLGIIPLGTGNDSARTLGIPAKRIREAIRIVAQSPPRTVDIGSATTADGRTEYFLTIACMGLDSRAGIRGEAMAWPKGDSRYLLAAVAEIAHLKLVDFTITVDGEELRDRTVLAAVGNGPFYGGGVRMCEGAAVDDGLLTLTWVHGCSAWTLLR